MSRNQRIAGTSLNLWTESAERKQPFLDERGNVVPAGSLGKYFELRDEKGIGGQSTLARSSATIPFAGHPPVPTLQFYSRRYQKGDGPGTKRLRGAHRCGAWKCPHWSRSRIQRTGPIPMAILRSRYYYPPSRAQGSTLGTGSFRLS